MSYSASILIAPVLTLRRFNDPAWARPDRTLYEAGSLKLWPGEDHPLLVDHDPSRRIGTVESLATIEWTDGPWVYARAIVDDPPPWLKRGTRASFGFGVVHQRALAVRDAAADVLAKGYVSEVSILSPGRRPKEPRAQVVSFRELPWRHGDVVVHGRGDEEVELIPAGAKPSRRGSILVRPGIGQVLGVR